MSITHNDDDTSWLNALLPTGVAITIGQRLRKTDQAPTDPETGEKDRYTHDQKQADVSATDSPPAPAPKPTSAPRSQSAIAATDPIGHVLDTTVLAYRPTETLRQALRWLCRKHHDMKSHDHLADRYLDNPGKVIEHYRSCPPTVTA